MHTPRSPHMVWSEQQVRKFLTTRFGIWFGRYVLPYLDKPVLAWSRGRYSMSPGQPILLLETTGAKSGKRRSIPLLYQRSGQQIIIIASNGGREWNPSWYHNLRANPQVVAHIEGTTRRYTAREAYGTERMAFWNQALAQFNGFALYEQRTTRHIPVIVLTPESQ